MQPRQQDFFSLVLFLLFAVANCDDEENCVRSVIFTNKLAVSARVSVYFHTAPLTEPEKISLAPTPQTLTKNQEFTFGPVEIQSGSKTYKCIYLIATNAGENKAECEVHKIFANGVVVNQRLELLPTPESDTTTGDSLLGYVSLIDIKNSLTTSDTITVTPYYSETAAGATTAGDVLTLVKDATGQIDKKPGPPVTYVRKLVVTVTIGGAPYTAICNVQKRYGSDVVDKKYLEVTKLASLDIIEVKPRATISETDGYVYSAYVSNLLMETATVTVYYSNTAPSGSVAPFGIPAGQITSHNIAGQNGYKDFSAMADPADGTKFLPIQKITSSAGGSEASVPVHTNYAKDKIAKKRFKIVYQTGTTGSNS